MNCLNENVTALTSVPTGFRHKLIEIYTSFGETMFERKEKQKRIDSHSFGYLISFLITLNPIIDQKTVSSEVWSELTFEPLLSLLIS